MSDERERIESDETGEAGRLESDRNEDDFEGHQLEVGRNEELGPSGRRTRPSRSAATRTCSSRERFGSPAGGRFDGASGAWWAPLASRRSGVDFSRTAALPPTLQQLLQRLEQLAPGVGVLVGEE